MKQAFWSVSIDANICFEGFVLDSTWFYMVGGVGDLHCMIGYF